ncbi:MAG: glycosyltransferase family 2 protein [Lachnospiraceae bacterium]|nr:glycosyltransferase family 2 protein [Lachnospiraceae bacterium]
MAVISVIIPVYNVEAYLKRCIDSVLSQDFCDIEIVLIDDGSTDQSGQICDQYQEIDSRIKVYHKENGGVSSARNYGLGKACGDYVTFLDSDDYYQPNWLTNLYNALVSSDADICVGNYTAVNNEQIVLRQTNHDTGVYETRSRDEKISHIISVVLTLKHGWEACTRLFKRQIIEDKHLVFCETCDNYAEDMSFVLSCLLYANRVVSISSAGYMYRKHEASKTLKSVKQYKFNELNEVSHFFIENYKRAFIADKNEIAVIHFLIMYSEYRKIVGSNEYPYLKKYLDRIVRRDYWRSNTKQIYHAREIMKKYANSYEIGRAMLLSHYCLHCNWKLFRLESALFYKIANKK